METNDTQLPFLGIMINKEGKKRFSRCLFKTNRLKMVCPLQIKPPQALLENYPLARRICLITEKDFLTPFHPEWGNFAPPPKLCKISRKRYG